MANWAVELYDTLAAAETAIETIANTKEIRLVAFKEGAHQKVFVAEGNTYLTVADIWETDISGYSGAGYAGTYLKTLYDDWLNGGRLDLILDAIEEQTDVKDAGRPQVFVKSITSAANAGDVTIATITTQPCIIDSIVLHADTASQSALTSAAISGGASKVVTFIDITDAAKANIDAVDEQVAWTGAVRLAAGKDIVISLVGTGATVVDLTISVTFHSEIDGGYLA